MSITTTTRSGGPPKNEDLKLMSMPSEILEKILHHTVEGKCRVNCIFNEGTPVLRRSHGWVFDLLRVSKTFAALARTVVSQSTIFGVYVPDDREDPGTIILEPFNDSTEQSILNLGVFPQYLQSQCRRLNIILESTSLARPCIGFDVRAFPKLAKAIISTGAFENIARRMSLRAFRTLIDTQSPSNGNLLARQGMLSLDGFPAEERETIEGMFWSSMLHTRTNEGGEQVAMFHVMAKLRKSPEMANKLLTRACLLTLGLHREKFVGLSSAAKLDVIIETGANDGSNIVSSGGLLFAVPY